MSLILEALRKSEAERRRGQTPDLLSDAAPVAPAARGTPRNRSVLAAVIGAALGTSLLVAWWLRTPAQPEFDVVSQQPSQATAETASVAPTDVPTRQPEVSLSPPAGHSPAKSSAAATPPATPSLASAPPADIAPAATVQQTDTSPSRIEPAPPPRPVVSSESAPAAGAAAAFTSPDAPLKLSDLSAEERQQLPTLKVSMHMWAPEVGNRFAIIDGTRVNEGDRLGDATIEAIQPDGVMLSWHGRHIRLPIR